MQVSHPSLVAVEIFRLPHFDSDEDRRKVMQSVQIGSSDIQRRQIICMYLGVGETWVRGIWQWPRPLSPIAGQFPLPCP